MEVLYISDQQLRGALFSYSLCFDAALRCQPAKVFLTMFLSLFHSVIADHQKQAALVTEYIASKRVNKVQYLNTNHSLRLGIAGPPGVCPLSEDLRIDYCNTYLELTL